MINKVLTQNNYMKEMVSLKLLVLQSIPLYNPGKWIYQGSYLDSMLLSY